MRPRRGPARLRPAWPIEGWWFFAGLASAEVGVLTVIASGAHHMPGEVMFACPASVAPAALFATALAIQDRLVGRLPVRRPMVRAFVAGACYLPGVIPVAAASGGAPAAVGTYLLLGPLALAVFVRWLHWPLRRPR